MDQLEQFIDKSIRLAAEKDYHPITFMRMRSRWGTIEAINRLMVQGDIQSGFKRMRELGLLHVSLEAAVLEFPDRFKRPIQDAARFRLDQVQKAA